ncbi:hypothetical protein [Spiroplasma endosymbiont of Polydrusus pterygomalis]|uniref:hypothetical protein n=1 Tax=Spiroplasma endosymbiont of Polydrusus pterygomalis TaxID=3139327 RepID=UPI003CCAB90D
MNSIDFFREYKVKDTVFYISIIEIEDINFDLKTKLDEYLPIICEGTTNGNLKLLKITLKKLFEKQTDNWLMGAIAEFFVHLFLNLMNYKQNCLFLNLEEGQIKKGFDGLYVKNEEKWIMESKSGSINTKNISHKNKLKEAIKDLNEKFSGKTTNNPWKNAYNHAAVMPIRNDNLLESIKKISADFISNKFYNITDFNIIPSATIFLENLWIPIQKDKIFQDIKDLLNDFNLKKAHIICISQKSIDVFKKYIVIKD